jgi:Asp-tRNA(Asn)/Glu-tRNA(Gln) amidotransferase A subunit family amidase
MGDISVIGPLARSADDLDLALAAMAGPDAIDAAGYKLALAAPKKTALRQFKVAVMLDDPNSEVDREVQDRIQTLADFLGKQKAKVSDTARPDIDTRTLHRVYVGLLRAATSSRQSADEFAQNQRSAAELKPDDDSYFAQMTRANVMSHRDWLGLNEERHKMRLKWAAFFKDYDLLLCPRRGLGGVPARSGGRALAADHYGQRQKGADHGPTVLGWLFVRHLSARNRRTDRLHQRRPAGRRADHRPTIRRPRVDRLRQADRARIPGLRAAARV